MERLTILQGSALARLRELPDESVQMCVTSPPYWNLRDYGVKGQLGLERTPALYVRKMVKIFREVRRVLKPDGTCWVNLGDSYASGKIKCGYTGERSDIGWNNNQSRLPPAGLKCKDMVGIPWRVAFALQRDGWYLRSDIVWAKPNPMPESVTDRPTKSHEYLFLFAKSHDYYYDAQAIKEPVTGNAHPRGEGVNPKARFPTGWASEGTHKELTGRYKKTPGQNSRIHVTRSNGSAPQSRQNESFSAAVNGLVDNRNKRSVWTVATYAFPDAHFATYPPDLIKPCILAGSRVGDVILDLFAGSGTSGQVALELGRRALLIELNPEYIPMIKSRCDVTPGLPLA